MYIIFFIQVKGSYELSVAAHFFIVIHASDRLFKRYVSIYLCRSASSFLLPPIFSLHFRKNWTSSVFFLKLGSLQVFPWNLRQLISYFFVLIIYSINLLKTARKTFATGNAMYPLPRTIIQITNDNSIFRKEGIHVEIKTSAHGPIWVIPVHGTIRVLPVHGPIWVIPFHGPIRLIPVHWPITVLHFYHIYWLSILT